MGFAVGEIVGDRCLSNNPTWVKSLLVKLLVIFCYRCLSNPTWVKSLLVKLLVIFLIHSYHLFI